MSRRLSDYKRRIKKALITAGTYTPALDINIHVMAGTLLCYDLAMADIVGLESAVVEEENSRGAVYTHAHPAFAIRREAEDQLRKQMKELGLTAEGTRTIVEDDRLTELATAINEMLGRGETLKPL